MEAGTLFRIRNDSRVRVDQLMEAIKLRKEKVGGNAYGDTQTLVTHIKRGLEKHLCDYSNDGMKGLTSTVANILISYKASISIKKRDVLQYLKDAAAAASTEDNPVKPEIIDGEEAQLEADRQNAYHLATIRTKEGFAAGISKLIVTAITNPILRTTDGSDFKTAEDYQIYELIKSITDGAGRPKETTIRRLYISIAGTHFDFHKRTNVNVERFDTEAKKSEKFGVEVHNDLKATIILRNIEWTA